MSLNCRRCCTKVPLKLFMADKMKYPYFRCDLCSTVIYSEIMQSVADDWNLRRVKDIGYEKFTEEVLTK